VAQTVQRASFGYASFDDALNGARAGDSDAVEHLIVPLLPALRGYLRGQRVGDVDDAVSDVTVRVLAAVARFDGDERSFRSWVFAIAHNRAVDGHRRRRDHAPLEAVAEPVARESTEGEAVARATQRELLAVLDRLTGSHRDVLLMRVVADLSVEETAAALGRTTGAVKVLQHRALRAVRKLVEGEV
jgi:RNA polymerase sigma-70 factor (ECF subfamily)